MTSRATIKRMRDELFNMHMCAKQFGLMARRAKRSEEAELVKMRTKTRNGAHREVVRQHAENSVRSKGEHIKFLRLQARMDAVCTRLEAAINVNAVSGILANVVRTLERTDEKTSVWQTALTMERFEKAFEHIDLKTAQMDAVIDSTAGGGGSAFVADVDELLQRVGDEHALDVSTYMSDSPAVPQNVPGSSSAAASNERYVPLCSTTPPAHIGGDVMRRRAIAAAANGVPPLTPMSSPTLAPRNEGVASNTAELLARLSQLSPSTVVPSADAHNDRRRQ